MFLIIFFSPGHIWANNFFYHIKGANCKQKEATRYFNWYFKKTSKDCADVFSYSTPHKWLNQHHELPAVIWFIVPHQKCSSTASKEDWTEPGDVCLESIAHDSTGINVLMQKPRIICCCMHINSNFHKNKMGNFNIPRTFFLKPV